MTHSEGDTTLTTLRFSPFMPIETDFDRIGSVTAQLDERWSKIPVLDIEVVMIETLFLHENVQK